MIVNKLILKKKLDSKLQGKVMNPQNIINAISDIISEELIAGNIVRFGRICSFRLKQRKGRLGVNPATGEKMNIPQKNFVKIIESKYIKEKIKSISL